MNPQQRYQAKHKATGLCRCCSKQAAPGCGLCERHRKYFAEMTRKIRARRRAEARCIECPRKLYGKGLRCEICFARQMEAQIRLRDRAKAKGWCQQCMKHQSRPGKFACESCAEKASIRAKARWAKKKQTRQWDEEPLSKRVMVGQWPAYHWKNQQIRTFRSRW